MNFTKHLLSGSTDGKLIEVVATITPGTLIHTAVSGTSDIDEIFIYGVNRATTATDLTVEWGGTTGTDNIEVTIQPESGLILIVPGLLLQNSQEVAVFDSLGGVNIGGYVNRITA